MSHPESRTDIRGEILELLVASTWDGQAVEPGEVATLRLASTPRGGLELTVDAPFHDDPAPPGAPGSTPGLWDYEVVELFIAEAEPIGPVRYLEIELSPHGHHLVLQLEGVRCPVEGMDQGIPLGFTARIDAAASRWTGEAILPVDWLPPGPHRVNAFAIYGGAASRRYLAWSPLPGDVADFHQTEKFPVTKLPASGPETRG